MNRGHGRGRNQTPRPSYRPGGRSSPSTHTNKPAQYGKDNKSHIHEHASGESSTDRFPMQSDEAVPLGSTSSRFERLKLVTDQPVEVFNSSKHLDGQPGSKFASDYMRNNPNWGESELSQPPSTAAHHMDYISSELMRFQQLNKITWAECMAYSDAWEHELQVGVMQAKMFANAKTDMQKLMLNKMVLARHNGFLTAAISPNEVTKCRESSGEKTVGVGRSEKPFDICVVKTGIPKLKYPLHVQHGEKRNEMECSMGEQVAGISILRPGMVLLKNFISCSEQVKIVQTCRKLGLGKGGFYQPGYDNGARMHLNMMCLGLDWDPNTSSYKDRRAVDGAEPPPVPSEFHQLVQKAIQDARTYILNKTKQNNVESVLPSMTPDICIVNFYTSNGKLGLHQDKDESQESLERGLPVVSISIGDSAQFLYGDERDEDKAEKVILESGDVLIYGGKSRHVYHGVTSITPNTAPPALVQGSDIRPGRLNLTFRKY